MVDKTRIQLLVEALESGEYKQGAGYLQPTGDRFCCLGVACDIYGKAEGVTWTESKDDEGPYTFIDSTQLLPLIVQKWFGFEISNPMVEVPAGIPYEDSKVRMEHLAALNDELRLDFKSIAKLLRAEYLEE